jgi:hypothetical protein
MAKRNQSSKCPQPRHSDRQQSSQFDKHSRLDRPNEDRERTERARIPLVGTL